MTDTALQSAFEAASDSYRTSAKEVLGFLNCLGAAVREMQEAGMDASLETRPRQDGCRIPPNVNDPSLANGTITISGTKVEFTFRRWAGFGVYIGDAKFSEDSCFYAQEETRKELVRRVLLGAKAEIDAVLACSVPADHSLGRKMDKPKPCGLRQASS